MLKLQSWECVYCSLCMCVFTRWWSSPLESCNDKAKLRGHLPYSGQSSEVSTPSSLYMEYGEYYVLYLFSARPLCLLSSELWGSSQLCGGTYCYSLSRSLVVFNPCARNRTALPFLLLLSDFGVLPTLTAGCWHQACQLIHVEWLYEWMRWTLKRGLGVSGLNNQQTNSTCKSCRGGSHLCPFLTPSPEFSIFILFFLYYMVWGRACSL